MGADLRLVTAIPKGLAWRSDHGRGGDAEEHPQAVVVDFAGVDFIDSQGSEKLHEIRQLVAASDAVLRLALVKPRVRKILDADVVIDGIGADRIHGNVDETVRTQLGTA